MDRAYFWATRKPTSGVGSTLVTPSDTTDLVNPSTGKSEYAVGFWVETAGNVVVVCPDGTTDTIPMTTTGPGAIAPIPVSRVKATNTTAGNVHVVW